MAVEPNRFIVEKTVRFGHCDPAGIIFYPRYFELLHEVLEDWFREKVGWPVNHFIYDLGLGFPTVKLETEFFAPSKLGDKLSFELWVAEIGRSSLQIHYSCSAGGQLRMRAKTIVVQTVLAEGKSRPLSEEFRARINDFIAGRTK